MKTFIIHTMVELKRMAGIMVLAAAAAAASCSMSEDFPLPTNPVEKHALPRSVIIMTITPDPTATGQVMQTWIIREINEVGMRIDSIRVNTQNSGGTITATEKLLESDIKGLWDYTYIPALWSGAGTRLSDISGESGGRIIVTLFGHDDNQYRITSADTLVIL